jgi:hypothetical protein
MEGVAVGAWCIFDAPYGFGLGERDELHLGPDFRREERGEELAVAVGAPGFLLSQE